MESCLPFYIHDVIDGSTFIGSFEIFDVRIRKKVKLVNIKCHDLSVPAGKEARNFTQDAVRGKEIYCKTFRDRYHKWSTVLVIMYAVSGDDVININDLLIDHNMAFTARSGDAD